MRGRDTIGSGLWKVHFGTLFDNMTQLVTQLTFWLIAALAYGLSFMNELLLLSLDSFWFLFSCGLLKSWEPLFPLKEVAPKWLLPEWVEKFIVATNCWVAASRRQRYASWPISRSWSSSNVRDFSQARIGAAISQKSIPSHLEYREWDHH